MMKNKICSNLFVIFAIQGLAFVLMLFFRTCAYAQMPSLTLPNGLGVCTHWTPAPSEMKAMQAAGVRWLRVDAVWYGVETKMGDYNGLAALDQEALEANEYGMKLVVVISNTNSLYDNGYSPFDSNGINGFTAFAKAVVGHFAGRGYIFELYNEPDYSWDDHLGNTWTANGGVNPSGAAEIGQEYVALATAVVAALKAPSAYPNEMIVGPCGGQCAYTNYTGSGAAFDSMIQYLLEPCLAAGLASKFSAVSVHPYIYSIPEQSNFTLVSTWAPGTDPLPNNPTDSVWSTIHDTYFNATGSYPSIIETENGFSYSGASGTSPNQNTSQEDAKAYLDQRILLNGNSWGIPLICLYDWLDDANSNGQYDPTNAQCNWGWVANHSHPTPATIQPLDTYYAIQNLYRQLNGYTFYASYNVNNTGGCIGITGNDNVLEYKNGSGNVRYVVWSNWGSSDTITFPAFAPNTVVTEVNYDGTWSGQYSTGSTGLYWTNTASAPYFVEPTPSLPITTSLLSGTPAWSNNSSPYDFVQNGNFDNTSSLSTSGWSWNTQGGFTGSVAMVGSDSNQTLLSGANCIKLSDTSTLSANRGGILSQWVSGLTVGQSYVLTVWCAAAGVGTQAQLATGSSWQFRADIPSGWNSFYLPVSVAFSADATSLPVMIIVQDPTTALYVDNISLVPAGALSFNNIGNGQWYASNVAVALSATPGTNSVVHTYYSVDNQSSGARQTYSAPITVSGDGQRAVTYWSVDSAGNSEPSSTQTIKIDTIPPTTSATVSGTTVTLKPTDAVSGVAATFYTVNSGARMNYSSPFAVTTSGTNTVVYWSVDKCGNIETAHTISVP